MPKEVYLVKVGMNMTEGVVEEWYIPDGDTVSEGELLYRLETEKVNLDVDAEASGTVKHLVGEGITMEPGDVVGYIYAAGEAIPDVLPGTSSATAGAVSGGTDAGDRAQQLASKDDLQEAPRIRPITADGRVSASPLARRLAKDRGVNLAEVEGTGPGGRIVEADILAAEPGAQTAGNSPAAGQDRGMPSSPMARKRARELGVRLDGIRGTGPGGRVTVEDVDAQVGESGTISSSRPDREIPLRGMRRTIASRMHESLQSMAQLTMDMDVRMDDAIKLRSQLIVEWSERGLRPTYTDLVIRAAAKSLRNHPAMNAQLSATAVVQKGDVNVGMAVALPDGLIVPVIKQADMLSLEEIAQTSSDLAAGAREGSLTPDNLQDGTFTVTALGMYGVDAFTPIINAPQAGILGVNRIREDTAWEDGAPVRVQKMRLSLTWDHRVLDGAPAAEFLAEVRDLLEAPYRLLV